MRLEGVTHFAAQSQFIRPRSFEFEKEFLEAIVVQHGEAARTNPRRPRYLATVAAYHDLTAYFDAAVAAAPMRPAIALGLTYTRTFSALAAGAKHIGEQLAVTAKDGVIGVYFAEALDDADTETLSVALTSELPECTLDAASTAELYTRMAEKLGAVVDAETRAVEALELGAAAVS